MKKVCVVFAIAALHVIAAPIASAHVLVTDTFDKTGAVLHIIADDDPIAGEVSSIYFDVQDTVALEGIQSARVAVKDVKNRVDVLDMSIDGSLATAKYTFPAQGQYTMTFTVDTKSQKYVYEQVQRVSRGTTDGALTQARHSWAEAALIGCVAAGMIGCILLWNHRKELWRRSTF